jgi:hypothetical protein
VQADIACGRAEVVIAELETLITEHPYREPIWAQLDDRLLPHRPPIRCPRHLPPAQRNPGR